MGEAHNESNYKNSIRSFPRHRGAPLKAQKLGKGLGKPGEMVESPPRWWKDPDLDKVARLHSVSSHGVPPAGSGGLER